VQIRGVAAETRSDRREFRELMVCFFELYYSLMHGIFRVNGRRHDLVFSALSQNRCYPGLLESER